MIDLYKLKSSGGFGSHRRYVFTASTRLCVCTHYLLVRVCVYWGRDVWAACLSNRFPSHHISTLSSYISSGALGSCDSMTQTRGMQIKGKEEGTEGKINILGVEKGRHKVLKRNREKWRVEYKNFSSDDTGKRKGEKTLCRNIKILRLKGEGRWMDRNVLLSAPNGDRMFPLTGLTKHVNIISIKTHWH